MRMGNHVLPNDAVVDTHRKEPLFNNNQATVLEPLYVCIPGVPDTPKVGFIKAEILDLPIGQRRMLVCNFTVSWTEGHSAAIPYNVLIRDGNHTFRNGKVGADRRLKAQIQEESRDALWTNIQQPFNIGEYVNQR